MKRIIVCLPAMLLLFSLAACYSQTDDVSKSSRDTESEDKGRTDNSHILIVYFTLWQNTEYPDDIDAATSASLVLDGEDLFGTTEYAAALIQQNVGGDLHAIQTTVPYPSDFDEVVDQNHEEMNTGALPELEESDLDISRYDTIFIGYPIWAMNAPRAVYSFLSRYDWSGKTIIPFCTHDGYGSGGSYEEIAAAIDDEEAVLDGLAIEASDVTEAEEIISEWLNEK